MQEETMDRRCRYSPPRCSIALDNRWIVRISVMDRPSIPRTILQQNQPVTRHSLSTRTIRYRLKQCFISARCPLLRLSFTGNHRCLRCQWCNKRRAWTT
ncbi:transposable element Tc1 transposase [Trichonephila clavipes]|nr:transposable element Tc1 transposase [Trichonephila clavipes]